MLRHKNTEKICFVFLILSIIVALVFMNAESLGITESINTSKYEYQFFDELAVNEIAITVNEDDWNDLLENASDKEYISCNLEINGEKFTNIAIRAKGNSSLQKVQSSSISDKYSLKIEFDHYDSTQSYHGLDKLCLNNIIQDNTMMKEYLIYTLMEEMGVPSPLVNYASVTVNGEDFGFYLAVEAIEEAFLQRNYGTQYGNAYKPETASQMAGGRGTTSTTETLSSAFGYDGTDVDSYSYIFDNVVTNISNSDKTRMVESIQQLNEQENLEEVLDIEQVIRYFVVHNFALNFDSYTGAIMHNYYIYEDNGILSVLPWDYNLSFASFMTSYTTEALANFPIDTPVSSGTVESRPLLAWIFTNEEYTELYHEIFAELMEEMFVSGRAYELLDDIEELITPYVENDDTKFCTFEEYQEGIVAMKEFIEYRVESIQGQLDGTVPSTSELQELEKEKLVSTGDLDISKAGSENAGSQLNGSSQGGMGQGGMGQGGMGQGGMGQGGMGQGGMSQGGMSQGGSGKGGRGDKTGADQATTMEGEMPDGMGEMPPMMEGEMPDGMGEMPPMMEGEMPDGMQEMPQMMDVEMPQMMDVEMQATSPNMTDLLDIDIVEEVLSTLDPEVIEEILTIVEGDTVEEMVENINMTTVMTIMSMLDSETIESIMGAMNVDGMPPMMDGEMSQGGMSQGGMSQGGMGQGGMGQGGMGQGGMSQGGMSQGASTTSSFDMATIIWLFVSIMTMLIALLAITSYKRR